MRVESESFFFEAVLVAYYLADRGSKLLGHALGYACGRNAARLRAGNLETVFSTPKLHRHFRKLRGFSRAGFSRYDYYAIFFEKPQNLRAIFAYRERFWIVEKRRLFGLRFFSIRSFAMIRRGRHP